jgi:hypothetical protein
MTVNRFIPILGALCAALLASSVAIAALPGKAQYSGQTSDSSTVRLRLSSSGKRVAKMRIYYKVTCDDGRNHTTYTDILNLRLGRTGKFAGKGTYTGSGDGSKNRFKVAGAVTKKNAKGSFSLTASGTDPTTARTVNCRTAALSWSALRKG